MARFQFLDDDEVRHLKQFFWFLLCVNLSVFGLGFVFARPFRVVDLGEPLFEQYVAILPMLIGVAIAIDAVFLLIVVGNVLLVQVSSFWKWRRDR